MTLSPWSDNEPKFLGWRGSSKLTHRLVRGRTEHFFTTLMNQIKPVGGASRDRLNSAVLVGNRRMGGP
jgi:hypothetical protein